MGKKINSDLEFSPSESIESTEGAFGYLDSEKTWVGRNDITGSSLSFGREFWIRAVNNTGVEIPNGTPIYPSGYDNTLGLVEIAPARQDDITKRQVIGVTTSTFTAALGSQGEVTETGWLNDLDTTGGAESWASKNELYIANTGGFTKMKPKNGVPIAFVGRVNATTGSLFIFHARSLNNFLDLSSGIEIATTTSASTDVLNGSYVLIAGTTTASNQEAFSQSANMTIQCNTSNTVEKNLFVQITALKNSGADRKYDLAIFKNGSIIAKSEIQNITISSSGSISLSIITRETLSPTDLLDVRIQGNGTADDITAKVKFII